MTAAKTRRRPKAAREGATPALRDRVVELRRVRAGDLVPHEQNWRRHPETQRTALRAAMTEIGFADAILARALPDGRLQTLDGHCRAELVPDDTVPVLVLDLSDDEARKLLVTLDPLAGMAETDLPALEGLLGELDWDLPALGDVAAGVLREARGAEGGDDLEEDEVPAPPAVPITQPGDVVTLGDHRLVCGSATDPDAVARCLDGAQPRLVVTSPPYPGVAMWNSGDEAGLTANVERLRALCEAVFRQACAVADVVCWNVADVPVGGQQVLWNSLDVLTWASTLGALVRPVLWDKGVPNPLPPPSFMRRPVVPHLTHEWVLVCYPRGWTPREKTSGLAGDEHEWQVRSVWTIAPEHASKVGHPAPFPVRLAGRCVSLFSLPGDVVWEPFAGSGTTIIAAEQLGRRCCAMEVEPRHVDLAVARWEALTGGKAKRERTH